MALKKKKKNYGSINQRVLFQLWAVLSIVDHMSRSCSHVEIGTVAVTTESLGSTFVSTGGEQRASRRQEGTAAEDKALLKQGQMGA